MRFTSSYLLAFVLLCITVKAHQGRRAREHQEQTFDYIVVGGGISGLVVANRLTENKASSVLVVERGDFANSPRAIIPYWATSLDTSVMLNFPSAPIPKLNNTSFRVPVAAVVGGGSVVNGMAYTRGSRADYDGWEELGNPGWGWEGLLPYFRKSTTFRTPSAEAVAQWNMTWDLSWYGQGPLSITIPDFQYPDITTFRNAWRHTDGVVERRDENGGTGPGLYWAPLTIDARDKTRATARKAYYDSVNAKRPNLVLLTGHTVTELLFHKLTATGVKITSRIDNSTTQVYARKEVILAAGAVHTPQLLQRSGIGPKGILKAAGIKVRLDLPGVGANFQDHATTPMSYTVFNQSFPNPDTIASNATYNATVWEEYFNNRSGPITAGSSSAIISLSLSQIATLPDSIANNLLAQDASAFLPAIYSDPTLLRGFEAQRKILAKQWVSNSSSVTGGGVPGNGFSARILFKPASRGTITIDRANPDGPPIVQYNTLSNPSDAAILVAMVRHTRKFWKSPAMAKFAPVEVAPGTQYQTDEEILFSLTQKGFLWPGLAHPSCSCAMMPKDLGGCVGPDLKVHGLEKLSIVDASILPMIPSTALQATIYAVGEKAADLIKGRA